MKLVPDRDNWRRLMRYRRDCYSVWGIGPRARFAVRELVGNIKARLTEEEI